VKDREKKPKKRKCPNKVIPKHFKEGNARPKRSPYPRRDSGCQSYEGDQGKNQQRANQTIEKSGEGNRRKKDDDGGRPWLHGGKEGGLTVRNCGRKLIRKESTKNFFEFSPVGPKIGRRERRCLVDFHAGMQGVTRGKKEHHQKRMLGFATKRE